MSPMFSLNMSISISIRRKFMFMVMSWPSSPAHTYAYADTGLALLINESSFSQFLCISLGTVERRTSDLPKDVFLLISKGQFQLESPQTYELGFGEFSTFVCTQIPFGFTQVFRTLGIQRVPDKTGGCVIVVLPFIKPQIQHLFRKTTFKSNDGLMSSTELVRK